jgi:acetylornithine deacetylase
MAAWPEAGPLNLAGIPSVVFGPKGCTGHEADEYVDIDSVVQCAQILRATVLDFLR